ncbi:hypothetical protein SARC_06623 [Sphaeroforma arctica JP610]|uniref:Uncharacterized protein n=1 Tax=Sphaeroforma arctica JP610 TaxID=667725 RepID=A0A0L0FWL4_9EUKA|nr:hypothetical protein SARC_06623 [Sphaeroforma arctica JP610]KNC81029.1 hypothetical protein SARC_06623 [Sphaeroforma arctica JP610]|eukprot:XP_014154931.1 hypothetical protein SARC_06623 [Sphaeroforma arctica JP610]
MSTLACSNLELADSKAMEDVSLIKFAITAFTTESLSSKRKMGLSSHGGTSVNQYPESANENSTWKRGLLWGSIALGVIVILLSLVLCSYFAYQKYANPTTTAEKGLKEDLDSKTREYLHNTQGSPRSSIVHSSTSINPTPQQALISGLSNTRTSSHSLLSYTQSFNNTNRLGAGHPTSCTVTNTAPSIFEYGASFKEKKARKDNEKKGQRLTRQKSMGDKDSGSVRLGAITLDPLPSQVEDHLNSYAGSPKQTATRMDSGFSFSSQTTVKGIDNSNCQPSETLNLTEQIVARLGSPPPRRQRNRSTSTGSETTVESRLNFKSENSVNYRTKPPTEPVKLDSVEVAQSPITEVYVKANARDKIPEAKPVVKVDNSLSTGLTVGKPTIRPPKSPLCQRSPSNLFREATLSATDDNPRTTSTTSASSAESCARSQTEMA